jgi:hypothetical protein
MAMAEIGDVNRNGQKLICKTNHPGTDYNKYVWIVYCTKPDCNLLYGVNGADFFERKCPNCQGGAPGLHLD